MNAQVSPSPTDTIYSQEPETPKFIFRAQLAVLFLPPLAFGACLVFNFQDVVSLLILLAVTFGAFWGIRTWADRKKLQWTNTWRWYESEVMEIKINLREIQDIAKQRSLPADGLIATVWLANNHRFIVNVPLQVVLREPLMVTYQARHRYGEREYQNVQFRDPARQA